MTLTSLQFSAEWGQFVNLSRKEIILFSQLITFLGYLLVLCLVDLSHLFCFLLENYAAWRGTTDKRTEQDWNQSRVLIENK